MFIALFITITFLHTIYEAFGFSLTWIVIAIFLLWVVFSTDWDAKSEYKHPRRNFNDFTLHGEDREREKLRVLDEIYYLEYKASTTPKDSEERKKIENDLETSRKYHNRLSTGS
ncbi:MAG: hypothetical protein LBL05_03745 [Synergistaceae bacterium]|jgi:hypothetical protein|nr:hypothetical protein [Synergistaceae bacterium]